MTVKEWTTRLLGHSQLPEGAPVSARKYVMREHLVAVRDDVAITDEEGEPVFSVDGRALQLRDMLVIRDRYDSVLFRIPQHELHRKNVMEIERDGGTAATIRRERTPGGHDHWTVAIPGGKTLQIRGSVPDHEYRVEADGRVMADVSKRWSRQPRTYGVTIPAGADDPLLLTIAAGVDQMTR